MPTYKGKPVTMWSLIPQKNMPPTRKMRYCCQVLKEQGGKNRFIATGVRWDESNARSELRSYEAITPSKKDNTKISDEIMLMDDNSEKRRLTEHCMKQNKTTVNPIIDWKNADIWDYIRSEKIIYNPLYDQGYYRVGCVGCPMAGKGRWKEFADFPTYKNAYIRSFDKMLEILKAKRKEPPRWKTGEDVFLWWMEDQNVEGQMTLEDFEVMP